MHLQTAVISYQMGNITTSARCVEREHPDADDVIGSQLHSLSFHTCVETKSFCHASLKVNTFLSRRTSCHSGNNIYKSGEDLMLWRNHGDIEGWKVATAADSVVYAVMLFVFMLHFHLALHFGPYRLGFFFFLFASTWVINKNWMWELEYGISLKCIFLVCVFGCCVDLQCVSFHFTMSHTCFQIDEDKVWGFFKLQYVELCWPRKS